MKGPNNPTGKDQESEERKRKQELRQKQTRFGVSYLILA